ncbi:MAG: hypothetical protein AAF456_00410 [Planctomycetota bacterium]
MKKKSLYEQVFGSWIIVAIALGLIALAFWTARNDEAFPEAPGQVNSVPE